MNENKNSYEYNNRGEEISETTRWLDTLGRERGMHETRKKFKIA
jgi:hypothetical protein